MRAKVFGKVAGCFKARQQFAAAGGIGIVGAAGQAAHRVAANAQPPLAADLTGGCRGWRRCRWLIAVDLLQIGDDLAQIGIAQRDVVVGTHSIAQACSRTVVQVGCSCPNTAQRWWVDASQCAIESFAAGWLDGADVKERCIAAAAKFHPAVTLRTVGILEDRLACHAIRSQRASALR